MAAVLTTRLALEQGDDVVDRHFLLLAGAAALVLQHAVVQAAIADDLGHRQRDMGNMLCNWMW